MTAARTLIIAEAGVNHNGSLDLALKLIETAKDTARTRSSFRLPRYILASQSADKLLYQQRTTSATESQLQMLQRLELDGASHRSLIEHCRKIGIRFLSSPFDAENAISRQS